MPRWLDRILQLRVITCMFYFLSLLVVVNFLSIYGEFDYEHIPEEKIQGELYRATVPNLVKKAKEDCRYDSILTSTSTVDSWDAVKRYDDFQPTGIVNGSYSPADCHPAFSIAVLVTYRNRQKQLDVFLPYIHNFLRQQNIHYKVFVIEQVDEKPWNKGLLYNIGAKRAALERFPCLLLHDVDLLPLDRSNLHVCLSAPRHMSASLDKYRYVLLYDTLVGGVLAIRADQFAAVGGFSNRFLGWGGEDDDFARRLAEHHLPILRFPRSMSRYTMLRHAPEKQNAARRRILAENAARAPGGAADGLASVAYTGYDVRPHRLFTHIRVKT